MSHYLETVVLPCLLGEEAPGGEEWGYGGGVEEGFCGEALHGGE